MVSWLSAWCAARAKSLSSSHSARRPERCAGASVRQALRLAVVGAFLGLVGALSLGNVMTGLLFETTPSDPLTLASVTALLLAVAVAASAVPARRATRIQPIEALRES